jgi:hypothetical protein
MIVTNNRIKVIAAYISHLPSCSKTAKSASVSSASATPLDYIAFVQTQQFPSGQGKMQGDERANFITNARWKPVRADLRATTAVSDYYIFIAETYRAYYWSLQTT